MTERLQANVMSRSLSESILRKVARQKTPEKMAEAIVVRQGRVTWAGPGGAAR